MNVDAQIQEIFDIEQKFGGNLDKEIMCIDTFKKNIQWMLDVILDSAILPAELDFLNEGERKQAIQDKNAINNSYRNRSLAKVIIASLSGLRVQQLS